MHSLIRTAMINVKIVPQQDYTHNQHYNLYYAIWLLKFFSQALKDTNKGPNKKNTLQKPKYPAYSMYE